MIIGLWLGAAFSVLKFCVYLEFAWHWRYTRRACTRRLAFYLDSFYIELHTIDNLKSYISISSTMYLVYLLMYPWTYNILHLLYLAHTLAVTGIACLGVWLLISPADKSPPALCLPALGNFVQCFDYFEHKSRHQIKYKVYLHSLYTQIIPTIKKGPCIHG